MVFSVFDHKKRLTVDKSRQITRSQQHSICRNGRGMGTVTVSAASRNCHCTVTLDALGRCIALDPGGHDSYASGIDDKVAVCIDALAAGKHLLEAGAVGHAQLQIFYIHDIVKGRIKGSCVNQSAVFLSEKLTDPKSDPSQRP